MLFDKQNGNAEKSNVPEFSVSELAYSIKHAVEERYGQVHVRGEISRVSIPCSGHMYTALKDERAVIDAVCWKGVLKTLSVRPEEGLEVICTGKMTTYPGNSKYQLVIESMALAGEGALLKMLEERKKKLEAEGLFAQESKKTLPFLPQKIGVVTSPTGAVIRDILHRLKDRFPRDVILWPVKVQGKGADQEIAKAINGLNALPAKQRPDLIIVARGGGSLEDLMPFNEEIVVRAAFKSIIPMISAVGHETDTTLIDYAADKRAPTPTGAAEMAVPVRLNLLAQTKDNEQRLFNAALRYLRQHRQILNTLTAKLGNPSHLLDLKMQQLDYKTEKLDYILKNTLNHLQQRFTHAHIRLTHPKQMLENKALTLESLTTRTHNAFTHLLANKTHSLERTVGFFHEPMDRIRTEDKTLTYIEAQLHRAGRSMLTTTINKLTHLTEKLELLSFENVLARGYIVIRDEDENVIIQPSALTQGQNINLQFKDQHYVGANITTQENTTRKERQKHTPPKSSDTSEKRKKKKAAEKQGRLF